MKRLLLPLIAALSLPTAVNAELVELLNDGRNGKNRQTIRLDMIYRKGDWIYTDMISTTYREKQKKSYSDTIRMKLNCKRRILDFNWGGMILYRKENGVWEHTWNRFSRRPVKEKKQFNLGFGPYTSLIFQETAEGAYKNLCKS